MKNYRHQADCGGKGVRGRFQEQKCSIAGRLGRVIKPILRPLGFDWKISTGMVGAFAT
jgi:Fe2+ transport system protein B